MHKTLVDETSVRNEIQKKKANKKKISKTTTITKLLKVSKSFILVLLAKHFVMYIILYLIKTQVVYFKLIRKIYS